MRTKPTETVEQYRTTSVIFATPPGATYGGFLIPLRSIPCSDRFDSAYRRGRMTIIVSDGSGTGWDHVSVSLPHRCPTWGEMCWVKDQFWREDECVVQFHPPKDDGVNIHVFCLHLWKRVGESFPMPPKICV